MASRVVLNDLAHGQSVGNRKSHRRDRFTMTAGAETSWVAGFDGFGVVSRR